MAVLAGNQLTVLFGDLTQNPLSVSAACAIWMPLCGVRIMQGGLKLYSPSSFSAVLFQLSCSVVLMSSTTDAGEPASVTAAAAAAVAAATVTTTLHLYR